MPGEVLFCTAEKTLKISRCQESVGKHSLWLVELASRWLSARLSSSSGRENPAEEGSIFHEAFAPL